jgi:DnaJ-class molecular chaperone
MKCSIDDWHWRKMQRTKDYFAKHGKKLVKCIACDGSGRYDNNGSPKCGSCGGTGKVREN